MLEGSCKSEQDSYWTTAEQEMNCENKREEEERKEERKKSADRLTSEPYTCERLSYTRGGYKDLTGSCTALQFDFTDPQVYTCTGSSFVLGNVTALGVLC